MTDPAPCSWTSRATPPRVRAALEPMPTRVHAHALPTCSRAPLFAFRPRHQGHPRGAPLRCALHTAPLPLTRACLRRRSPPAASASSPPVRLGPIIAPVAPKLTVEFPCLRRSPACLGGTTQRTFSQTCAPLCFYFALTPDLVLEQISENAEKLQCAHGSNPNPRRLTTVVATRAHPCPCLRRMGEISERLLQ